MLEQFTEHPLRVALTNEVHTRPYVPLAAPLRASHLAMMSGETGAASDLAAVNDICERYGRPRPEPGRNFHLVDCGDFRLRWERHTEFSSYTFYAGAEAGEEPFARPALAAVPEDWLKQLPGTLLVALHIAFETADAPLRDGDVLAGLFSNDNFAGGRMSGGAARAWMDFARGADGFGRILVRDQGLRPRQAGRLIQRLVEIETYRTLALLAFPVARETAPKLSDAGDRLVAITDAMTSLKEMDEERRLLAEITLLSAETERLAAATGYRFAAARAYHALVEKRIDELREERVEGYQTIREFMARRLAPAMRTCEAVTDRIDRLSRRLTRAGQLLRTRVDIELEAQNKALLESMDRRARLQLRLQETVETISVAAISYYLVSLVGYAAKAAKQAGARIDPDIVMGLAIVPVALLVWYGIRRVRARIARAERRGEQRS